jgi:hypothetical protein
MDPIPTLALPLKGRECSLWGVRLDLNTRFKKVPPPSRGEVRRGMGATNHESRITNHELRTLTTPALPLKGRETSCRNNQDHEAK